MLNANEANESVWMGSRTPVSITRSTYFMTIFYVKVIGDNVVIKVNVLNILIW